MALTGNPYLQAVEKSVDHLLAKSRQDEAFQQQQQMQQDAHNRALERDELAHGRRVESQNASNKIATLMSLFRDGGFDQDSKQGLAQELFKAIGASDSMPDLSLKPAPEEQMIPTDPSLREMFPNIPEEMTFDQAKFYTGEQTKRMKQDLDRFEADIRKGELKRQLRSDENKRAEEIRKMIEAGLDSIDQHKVDGAIDFEDPQVLKKMNEVSKLYVDYREELGISRDSSKSTSSGSSGHPKLKDSAIRQKASQWLDRNGFEVDDENIDAFLNQNKDFK